MKLIFNILIAIVLAKLVSLTTLFFTIDSDVKENIQNEAKSSFYYYNFEKLFKEERKEIKKVERKRATFTITDITLKAIYEDKENSMIIVEYRNKTEFLNIGDEFRGFKVTKVNQNSAILEKNSKVYELFLEKEKDEKKSNIITTNNNVVKNSEPFVMNRDTINSYKSNISKLLSEIKLAYVKQNGRLIGYEVSFIKPNSFLASTGLRVGDVIFSVNDKVLKSDNDILILYQNLDSINFLKLGIKRLNREIFLDIVIE